MANAIATTLVGGATGVGAGTTGVFVAVYVATFFLCNVVGNNAAAALMYPIAAGAAEQQGIDRDQMAFLLMLAASASFMSPFGYQTNLMVYGPGGYVFADFSDSACPCSSCRWWSPWGWCSWGQLVGGVGRGIRRLACICVTQARRREIRRGEKRDDEGPGMEKKKLAKIGRRTRPSSRWTAHAQTVLLAGVV